MKPKLILGNSDTSLVPLFSSELLSILFNTMWMIGFLLLIFWPQKSYFLYFQEQDTPLNFLIIFLAVFLVISYLGLYSGKGEFIIQDFAEKMTRMEKTVEEEQFNFLTFGLVRFSFQILFFCLPYGPILIISAALSEISLAMLSWAFLILYVSALICRLFGFLVYLFFGKWSPMGSLISWGFFIGFIVGTGFFAPFANPVILIYYLFRGSVGLSVLESQAQSYFVISMISTLMVLIVLCWLKVGRRLGRETP